MWLWSWIETLIFIIFKITLWILLHWYVFFAIIFIIMFMEFLRKYYRLEKKRASHFELGESKKKQQEKEYRAKQQQTLEAFAKLSKESQREFLDYSLVAFSKLSNESKNKYLDHDRFEILSKLSKESQKGFLDPYFEVFYKLRDESNKEEELKEKQLEEEYYAKLDAELSHGFEGWDIWDPKTWDFSKASKYHIRKWNKPKEPEPKPSEFLNKLFKEVQEKIEQLKQKESQIEDLKKQKESQIEDLKKQNESQIEDLKKQNEKTK